MKEVLHVPQQQGEPDVDHHGQPDDLRRGSEVAKRAGLGHPCEGNGSPAPLKRHGPDSAIGRNVLGHAGEVSRPPARSRRWIALTEPVQQLIHLARLLFDRPLEGPGVNVGAALVVAPLAACPAERVELAQPAGRQRLG